MSGVLNLTVKQHDWLHAGSRSNRGFLSLESANISLSGYPAIAWCNACAFFHRPKKLERVTTPQLRERSASKCHCFFPLLWPGVVMRRLRGDRWQGSDRLQWSKGAVMLGSPSRCNLAVRGHSQRGVSHVVGPTLGSHAYRIGGGGAWVFI